MTLNGVMAVILRYFSELGSLRAHYVKVVKDIPKLSAIEMYTQSFWFLAIYH